MLGRVPPPVVIPRRPYSSGQVSFTNNSRSAHDAWGGWQQGGGQLESALVAAVNALVAARARVFVSPRLSAWTLFVQRLSATDEPPQAAVVPVCCAAQAEAALRERPSRRPKAWWFLCAVPNFHLSCPSSPAVRREADAARLASPATLARRCRLWQNYSTLLKSGETLGAADR